MRYAPDRYRYVLQMLMAANVPYAEADRLAREEAGRVRL